MLKKNILVLALIVFSIMLSSFSFYFYQVLYTPNFLIGEPLPKVLSLPKGTTFSTLQKKLTHEKWVHDIMSFSLLSKIMDFDKQVKPGHYTIPPDMNNLDFIRFLRLGNPIVQVTFQSMRSLEKMAQVLGYYLSRDSTEWSNYFQNEKLGEKFDRNKENLIGMFLPDTYEMYYQSSPEVVMNVFYKEYQKFWNEKRKNQAKAMKLSPQEVTILASIVQAETNQISEASTIAGVYKNRLEKGMKLQADPTLVFAKGDFTLKRVLNDDKNINSPYNTYLHKGLPPGPINMPSKAFVEATLQYEKHDYLYFCAKADFSGFHDFSKTYREHLVKARKFQKEMNKRKIFR